MMLIESLFDEIVATSPKAFFRSIRVMTTERCFMRALSIMDATIEVCSKTPEIFRVNSFWNSVSKNSFLARKEKIESRRHEVKTLRGIDSRVIGLTLAGSSLVPFLCTRTVQAFFNSHGTRPYSGTMRIFSVRNVLRYGHLLKQTVEILSKVQGEPEDLLGLISASPLKSKIFFPLSRISTQAFYQHGTFAGC